MKTRILLVVMLLLSALAFGQTTIPTCNSFNAGTPVYLASPTATPTPLCTDYFGKANYANSPLPVAPVDFSPTGFTIMDGGSGYSSGTTVTITDFYNTPLAGGATATVTVDPLTGSITAITGTGGGSGYVAPVVNIIDPLNTGAGALILAKLDASQVVTGTGMRKFVDALPALPIAGLTTGVATDITTFPNSDYYEIALVEYAQQLHADLPATQLRGYVQIPSGSNGCAAAAPFSPQYLGPVILAQKTGPCGSSLPTACPRALAATSSSRWIPPIWEPESAPMVTTYTQNRATLHLHGGNTPWISDGTPHQWTVPVGETTTTLKRGVSTQNVPDMFFVDGVVVPQCSRTVTSQLLRAEPRRNCRWGDERSGRRLDDVLLDQPAGRPVDVLPRPCLRHHPPQCLRR